MTLDLFSVTVMTAIVALVATAIFVIETLRRRDAGAGRLWAVAYLCGTATTFAYISWAAGVGGAVAIAFGNASFILTPAFIWLGNRRFNDRPIGWQSVAVGTFTVLTFVAAVIRVPVEGSWGGWTVMAALIVVLFAAGGWEALRRPMGRLGNARLLTGVLFAAAVYYAARLVVFLVDGPQGAFFDAWFGSISANIVTVVLTMVAVVVTSILRASKSAIQRYEWLSENGVAADGIMLAGTYRDALRDMAERAGWRQEIVSVIVVHVDGLDEMGAAFGSDAADELAAQWRRSVRRHAPASAFVGEDGDSTLSVCGVASTAADARRQAAAIYRGCIDDLAGNPTGLLPVVGIGIGLTETVGYDTDTLLTSARAAALRASRSLEASVLFGGVDEARSHLG
ncbi:diguanylate cyclase [Microbacterium sp. EYE_5]|uniref:diguanylate cyclase n=1 Tax=unclassified Microbacterium TaxID=2609290 RepID=UPI002005FB70|nr:MULTISPECIES: diguanylate cyclase [unclassified Microbacterium]MCK6080484.1 diguanylate cyclase [Microbacterium sp. EYE_382]MCK6085755.1 diguanylate cyclase [Microbacterium sp. EYE_384]MCK6124747.1 diguanylate cyclase [Microbacterium sp. EYE_80]MCK6127656.1 diguanylate cyclase [Microbacterium sp. EYE_79]MCK6141439.1 diguanylate cyclase [Microbacterium sp. EYE_39]